jgi:hypothetical protein
VRVKLWEEVDRKRCWALKEREVDEEGFGEVQGYREIEIKIAK